ncbi:MAG: hypothetical protein JSW38_01435 [Dehalococcoidia bacterium]|nr:MAG: hypothetical protein JSW38_01435 [Dehalococcoidia bacterium]
MRSRKRRLLILGLSSALVGVLLVASFQFVSDHRWYWNVAPLVCIVALLGTVFGGLLLGISLPKARHTRLWLVAVGAILGFIWTATGVLATVLGALGMSYLTGIEGHVGWDTYAGGILFNGAHIRFLQIAAGTGFMGGIALGLGLAWRRVSAVLSLNT